MSNYTAADIKQLRETTGAGMLDCKKALDASDGDMTKAEEWVRQKGLARAASKSDRETNEGYIATYVHHTHKIAAMVEVLCETDFVARNDEFQKMAADIALHVVSMQPETVEELLEQEFVKDPDQTISQLVQSLSGKIGEKFVINRFVVYQVGQ